MGYHARTISLVCFRARKGSKRKEVKKQVKCPIKGSIEKLDRTLHFLRVLEFEVSSNNTWCCFNIMIQFPQKKNLTSRYNRGQLFLLKNLKILVTNEIQNIITLPFYWFRDGDSDTYLKKWNWNIRKKIVFRLSLRRFVSFLK